MKENVKNYNDLLLEEKRLITQIDQSKSNLDKEIEELLSLSHLLNFLKDKIKEKVKQDFTSKVALKEALINASLDFVYEKLTSLLEEDEKDEDGNKSAATGIKSTAKLILDAFYIDYKPIAIAYISSFIDENIEKLMKK